MLTSTTSSPQDIVMLMLAYISSNSISVDCLLETNDNMKQFIGKQLIYIYIYVNAERRVDIVSLLKAKTHYLSQHRHANILFEIIIILQYYIKRLPWWFYFAKSLTIYNYDAL